MQLPTKILFLVVVLAIAMELTNASPTEAHRTDGDLARFEILNEFKGMYSHNSIITYKILRIIRMFWS